jgi:hypothetical protein
MPSSCPASRPLCPIDRAMSANASDARERPRARLADREELAALARIDSDTTELRKRAASRRFATPCEFQPASFGQRYLQSSTIPRHFCSQGRAGDRRHEQTQNHPGQDRDVFTANMVDERHGGRVTIGYGRYGPNQSLTETMAVDDTMIVLEGRLTVKIERSALSAGPGEIIFMHKGEAVDDLTPDERSQQKWRSIRRERRADPRCRTSVAWPRLRRRGRARIFAALVSGSWCQTTARLTDSPHPLCGRFCQMSLDQLNGLARLELETRFHRGDDQRCPHGLFSELSGQKFLTGQASSRSGWRVDVGKIYAQALVGLPTVCDIVPTTIDF